MWREAKAEIKLEEGEDIVRGDGAEDSSLPDDVPKKAGVVVKAINDDQYYYYWRREGD